MGEDDFDFDARMVELAQAFLDALPGKYDELVQQWQLWHVEEDLEAVGRLRLLVHRLGGSADNYGYEVLGRSARAMDVLLAHDVSPKSLEKPFAELLVAMNTVLDDS